MKTFTVQVSYDPGAKTRELLGMKSDTKVDLFVRLNIDDVLLPLCFANGSEHCVPLTFSDPTMNGRGCTTMMSFKVSHTSTIWHEQGPPSIRIYGVTNFQYNMEGEERASFIVALFASNNVYVSAFCWNEKDRWVKGSLLADNQGKGNGFELSKDYVGDRHVKKT